MPNKVESNVIHTSEKHTSLQSHTGGTENKEKHLVFITSGGFMTGSYWLKYIVMKHLEESLISQLSYVRIQSMSDLSKLPDLSKFMIYKHHNKI